VKIGFLVGFYSIFKNSNKNNYLVLKEDKYITYRRQAFIFEWGYKNPQKYC